MGTISHEADFFIHDVANFTLAGQKLSITTTHVCMTIVTIFILVLLFFARRRMINAEEVPGTFQTILETIVDMLDNLVATNMGKSAPKFANYISILFVYILICNIAGITGLRSPTADYGVTLALALITFVLIHFNGIKNQKGGYFKAYIEPYPIFLPINLISEVATPVSMSLRLFANMLSGTIIMALWYGMLPIFLDIGLPSFLHVYFDLFSGAIQTYVFCMLTMLFVTQKIEG